MEFYRSAETLKIIEDIIGYNDDDSCFLTPEPLGPGGDPYPAMYGKPDPLKLDKLVKDTVEYFREREHEVLSL